MFPKVGVESNSLCMGYKVLDVLQQQHVTIIIQNF